MITDDELIRNKMEEIVKVIEGYNSTWFSIINHYLIELKTETDLSNFASEILHLYGGMGSFSDLVLQQNGKMPIEENDKLKTLKKELYKICESIVINSRRFKGNE